MKKKLSPDRRRSRSWRSVAEWLPPWSCSWTHLWFCCRFCWSRTSLLVWTCFYGEQRNTLACINTTPNFTSDKVSKRGRLCFSPTIQSSVYWKPFLMFNRDVGAVEQWLMSGKVLDWSESIRFSSYYSGDGNRDGIRVKNDTFWYSELHFMYQRWCKYYLLAYFDK